MALADKYLYDGERILDTLSAGDLLGERELAATDSRIICTQPDKFYDIRYESLSSIGYGPIYRREWAYAAFFFTALAIVFAGSAALVPGSLPFGPFSIGLGGLVSLIRFPGVVGGAFAVAAIAVFWLTVRRGVVMRTPGGTFVFACGKRQRDRAAGFTKAVRAACDRRT